MVETLTIAPLPRSIMPGTNAAVRVNGATTLNSSTALTSSIGISWLAPNGKIPALLTSTSTSPAACASFRAPSGAERSAAMKRAWPAGGLDRVYDLSAARLVAAGHDHLRAGAAELFGGCPTDA